MAVGAALQDSAVPTVLALGDGGIGMYFAELRIAVERKLPLLVLLMSDGGFGSIRDRAVKDDLTQKPLVISNPSWLKAAEGLGLNVARAEDAAAMETLLAEWNATNGPLFLELPFDPEAYRQMVREIR